MEDFSDLRNLPTWEGDEYESGFEDEEYEGGFEDDRFEAPNQVKDKCASIRT